MTPILIEEYGGRRRPATLVARIATGSQGDVWTIDRADGLLAKVLYPSYRPSLAERLDVLAAPPLAPAGNRDRRPARAAWPTGRAYDSADHSLVGFTMQHLARPAYFPLDALLLDDQRDALLPGSTWSWSVSVAIELARAVDDLGGAGVVLGDLAPRNILVTSDARVTLLDVDGWQLGRPGERLLPCPRSRPEYTAPELLDVPAGSVRAPSSDHWAVAVVVAQILLLGTHPFAGVRAGARPPYDEVANVRAGHCWLLGHEVTLRPRPPAIDALLTGEMKYLFDRALGEGRTRPHRRPTAARWVDALEHGRRNLVRCTRNARHVHLDTAPTCPWCELSDRGHERYPAPERTRPAPQAERTHDRRAR